MSFLREDTIVLCVVSSDPLTCEYEADLVRELHSKGLGRVVAAGASDFAADAGAMHVPSLAAELPDHLRTPFEVVFAQILGYYLSLKAGLNPDQPSPDGVIARVVPEFRIYEGRC
jgi:tagatose-6-phosphate ketose/aldose isomerase